MHCVLITISDWGVDSQPYRLKMIESGCQVIFVQGLCRRSLRKSAVSFIAYWDWACTILCYNDCTRIMKKSLKFCWRVIDHIMWLERFGNLKHYKMIRINPFLRQSSYRFQGSSISFPFPFKTSYVFLRPLETPKNGQIPFLRIHTALVNK